MNKRQEAKQRYYLARNLCGVCNATTILARCRYAPWRYLFLPLSLLAARIARRRARKAQRAIDYSRKGTLRPIAFYLPQFHAIPENDQWWGKGFTEWTNVRRAEPIFDGHYQPHVPHPNLGYYDLGDVEVMRKQAEMAKRFGIYGFCFYYYHFKDGKRLLEKPLDHWLAHPEIDLPFCYCWANENWTRAWDGGDKEILMRQDYDMENMERLLHDMIPAFKDPRYIRTDGKPMLLVYRAELIPEMAKVAAAWRRIARENGFQDLHLVHIQNLSRESPKRFGMDAASEFACFHTAPLIVNTARPIELDSFKGTKRPVRYKAVRDYHLHLPAEADYPRYKCVCPGWDNTPRRGLNATLIVDGEPVQFGAFLDEAFSATLADERLRKEGFVFVNAWNEWGEGAHLEPDVRYGYSNLEQVAAAIKRFSE